VTDKKDRCTNSCVTQVIEVIDVMYVIEVIYVIDLIYVIEIFYVVEVICRCKHRRKPSHFVTKKTGAPTVV
jgi:hypothetical protein